MKNKSCKFVIIVSAVAMMLTGCNAAQAEQPPVMQNGTPGTNATTSVVTTVPSVNVTTVPTAVTTAPTKQPTAPTTVPTVPIEPTGTTVPSTEATIGSTTETTVVSTTKPTTVQTTVATTTCQHTYGQPEVIKAATCTEAGLRAAKCSKCGQVDSKGQEPISKLGHNWVYQESKSYPPDSPAGYGRIYYQCSRCQEWKYDKWYMDDEMIEQYCREVEQVILTELNRYRVEAGQEPLTYLPRLSEVCQYRAYQIHQKSGQDVHNDDDINAAFNKFQYGVYVDMVKVEQELAATIPGYVPKDVTEADNYWGADGTEAVTSCRQFIPVQNAEERGIDAMEGLRASTGHWSYLGSDLYSYVGIGVYCGTNGIYTNIWVSDTNYG